MYNILIVDDEVLVVRGLSELIKGHNDLPLEVFQAYSAMEAFELMKQYRIDIVITDIQMPMMNGLELHNRIHQFWPKSKVIFLTGYDNFHYIKEAIKKDALDYVLKVEGDQVVLAAIRKAIEQLDKEFASESFMIKARDMTHQAKWTLQREYLTRLLEGDPAEGSQLDKSFKELQIPLNPRESVLLVVGKIDEWKESLTTSDRALLTYAVQNIAEELLQPVVSSFSINMGRAQIVWFIQTGMEFNEEETRFNAYVQGTFEMIQNKCQQLLGLSISVAIASAFVPWAAVERQEEKLRFILKRYVGFEREVLLVENDSQVDDSMLGLVPRNNRKYVDQLRLCLENNKWEEYQKHFSALIIETSAEIEANVWNRKETFMELSTLFLSFIHQWDIKEKIKSQIDLSLLISYDRFRSWKSVLTYFETLAESVFQNRYIHWHQQGHNLVSYLQEHIRDNVGEDLSLTRLGELVNHNPTYLSRLYKQLTGIGLSETIANARIEKAKSLLKDPKIKIYEVGKAVGFESSKYFRMFFRNATTLTPQEYRELQQTTNIFTEDHK
jgi:two-component system response regulator YesN